MAAPARLQRRDAEILKNELNCNMVRCSHYPQSPHFLDACDELGLMVWEEPPGWQYVGDAASQAIVLQNVHDMVVRDRNRPSVIVWGTRLNETANYPDLYARPASSPTSWTAPARRPARWTSTRLAGWAEDVFGYDDYHSDDGNAALEPPLPGVPYLVSEAVGALDGLADYRWIDTGAVAGRCRRRCTPRCTTSPSRTRRTPACSAGAGIDYASLNGGNRIWRHLKTPGVMDTFRVPKPGAAFYRSQVDPRLRPVILPVFFWDFGPDSPPTAPARNAMIATNCDRLEIYVGGGTSGDRRPRPPRLRQPGLPAGVRRPHRRRLGAARSCASTATWAAQLVASVRMSADTSAGPAGADGRRRHDPGRRHATPPG